MDEGRRMPCRRVAVPGRRKAKCKDTRAGSQVVRARDRHGMWGRGSQVPKDPLVYKWNDASGRGDQECGGTGVGDGT